MEDRAETISRVVFYGGKIDKLKKKEQKQIAELLFKYFIMNDKYIAVK